uniref:tetratricopeptide repeat protein n=1 Tax=Flavobacterium sp. TaxID=239 RepID=UPI004049456D
MKQSSFLKILFLFILSTNHFVAQTTDADLQRIWENSKNADSIRFNAINEFYKKNTASKPDDVIKITDFHLELAKKKNNKNELIKALSEKSYVFYVKDNIKKSEENIREAIKIQITLNDEVALARLYANLASICRAQSKFLETIRYYNDALKIFESSKEEKLEATVLGNIGLVYFDLKNNEIKLNSHWFDWLYS